MNELEPINAGVVDVVVSAVDVVVSAVDVVVVGGGPAGLSASLALVRARRSVVVIDGGEPRNGVAPHMHGVLGHDGLPPTRLLELGRAEIEGYGGRIIRGRVDSVSVADDGVTVTTGSETIRARRLIVATGLRDELPDIDGVREQWGRGVVVCPYCDGWERRHQVIAVIATSTGSLHQAQMLRQWSDRIVYFSNGVGEPDDAAAEALDARGIRLERRRIRRLVIEQEEVAGAVVARARVAAAETAGEGGASDGVVTGIELADGEVVPVGAVFTGPTMLPNDELLRSLGARTKDTPMGNWVDADADGRTSVPRVWAVGNVIDPRANVPVSLGAGSLLAGAVNMDLIEEEIATALESRRERVTT